MNAKYFVSLQRFLVEQGEGREKKERHTQKKKHLQPV